MTGIRWWMGRARDVVGVHRWEVACARCECFLGDEVRKDGDVIGTLSISITAVDMIEVFGTLS